MPDHALDSEKTALFLAEARWQRDDQSLRVSALNQKLVTTFTLNVAVVALFVASLRFAGGPLSLVVDCLVYSTIFLFVIGVGVAALAYAVAIWYRRPNLQLLREHLAVYDSATMALWVADEIVRALDENERLIDVKAGRVQWAIALAAATAVMVGVTAAVSLGVTPSTAGAVLLFPS